MKENVCPDFRALIRDAYISNGAQLQGVLALDVYDDPKSIPRSMCVIAAATALLGPENIDPSASDLFDGTQDGASRLDEIIAMLGLESVLTSSATDFLYRMAEPTTVGCLILAETGREDGFQVIAGLPAMGVIRHEDGDEYIRAVNIVDTWIGRWQMAIFMDTSTDLYVQAMIDTQEDRQQRAVLVLQRPLVDPMEL